MRHALTSLSLVLVLSLPLGGCAVPHAAKYDAPLEITRDSYIVAAGDKISVSIYGEDKLVDRQFTVNPEGEVTIPLVGSVKASGLQRAELEDKIKEKLVKKGMYSDPIVDVDVSTRRPIYILGEVGKPDRYEYEPAMSALKAVAAAGGYTPRAARNRMLIDRGVSPRVQRLNATEATPLLPGDTIIVRERIF